MRVAKRGKWGEGRVEEEEKEKWEENGRWATGIRFIKYCIKFIKERHTTGLKKGKRR